VRSYLNWIDAKIDPARGIGFWRFYWTYKLLYVLHLIPFILIAFLMEAIGLGMPGSFFYYAWAVTFMVYALAVPIFLWFRRGILSSKASRLRANPYA